MTAGGKVVAVTGELADTVGVQNPFRYKGYYYDNETGMYYLKSRYYDAEIKRFICADVGITSIIKDTKGNNLFCYCFNNPLKYERYECELAKNGLEILEKQ